MSILIITICFILLLVFITVAFFKLDMAFMGYFMLIATIYYTLLTLIDFL